MVFIGIGKVETERYEEQYCRSSLFGYLTFLIAFLATFLAVFFFVGFFFRRAFVTFLLTAFAFFLEITFFFTALSVALLAIFFTAFFFNVFAMLAPLDKILSTASLQCVYYTFSSPLSRFGWNTTL
jgi:hypothetical protein